LDKIVFFFFSIFIIFSNGIYGQTTHYFRNLQWMDSHSEIEEAHILDEIIIRFETENVPDNENIFIEIWKQTNNELMDLITALQGTVINNTVNIFWVVEFDETRSDTHYAREIIENGYTIINYVFLIKYNNMNIISKPLAVLNFINIVLIDDVLNVPIGNTMVSITSPDGEVIQAKSDENGIILIRNLRKKGEYFIDKNISRAVIKTNKIEDYNESIVNLYLENQANIANEIYSGIEKYNESNNIYQSENFEFLLLYNYIFNIHLLQAELVNYFMDVQAYINKDDSNIFIEKFEAILNSNSPRLLTDIFNKYSINHDINLFLFVEITKTLINIEHSLQKYIAEFLNSSETDDSAYSSDGILAFLAIQAYRAQMLNFTFSERFNLEKYKNHILKYYETN